MGNKSSAELTAAQVAENMSKMAMVDMKSWAFNTIMDANEVDPTEDNRYQSWRPEGRAGAQMARLYIEEHWEKTLKNAWMTLKKRGVSMKSRDDWRKWTKSDNWGLITCRDHCLFLKELWTFLTEITGACSIEHLEHPNNWLRTKRNEARRAKGDSGPGRRSKKTDHSRSRSRQFSSQDLPSVRPRLSRRPHNSNHRSSNPKRISSQERLRSAPSGSASTRRLRRSSTPSGSASTRRTRLPSSQNRRERRNHQSLHFERINGTARVV